MAMARTVWGSRVSMLGKETEDAFPGRIIEVMNHR